jgi:subfamily B ATP-binding cassette protein MsbA
MSLSQEIKSDRPSTLLRIKNRLKKTSWYEIPAFRLIGRAAWPQLSLFSLVFILGVFSAVFEGATFVLLAIALDLLSNDGATLFAPNSFLGKVLHGWDLPSAFVLVVILAILCQVLRSITAISATVSNTVLASRISQTVQRMIFEEILRFDFSSASKFKAGELTSHITTHGEAVSLALRSSLDMAINSLTILSYVILLCVISFPLFLATTILFALIVGFQRSLSRKIKELSRALQELSKNLSRRIVETINALRLIHSYHAQHSAHRQVVELQDAFMAKLLSLQKRMALIVPVADSLMVIGLGAFLLMGFFLFRHDKENLLPSLLTFVAVLNRLSTRVSTVSGTSAQVQSTLSRLRVVDELFLGNSLKYTRTGGHIFPGLKEKIVFDKVSLVYPDREAPSLDAVSFTIPKGSSVALVGPSGGGKSTLADLLLGLYEPTAGCISIDGADLMGIEPASWRSKIGVVSQDTVLFNASIRDNIAFAKPDATSEQIKDAAKSAQALDFIEQLPDGFDTQIGERGFMLSGGQRQRLAIARALLRRPEILILDEATSALDTASESAVQKTIDGLDRSVTRLMVAHRLSTIAGADIIVVLENGRIAELGNHEQLIEKNGIYAKSWKNQSQV